MAKRGGRRDAAKEANWRRWVALQTSSGLNIRAFCQREQLSEASFYAWRKELMRRTTEAEADHTSTSAAKIAKFAEVRITPTPACQPIELVLSHAYRVVIPPGFDRASLQAVLEILERPTC